MWVRSHFRGEQEDIDCDEVHGNALKELQNTLNEEIESGVFSEDLLLALGIIAAIACFTGMFDTAVIHCDALIKVLEIRGKGDVLQGLYATGQWTRKALQWYVWSHLLMHPTILMCLWSSRLEILIAVQLVETPRILYICTFPSSPLSPQIILEAQRRTIRTLSHFSNLVEPLEHVILLLHQLSVAYNTLPPNIPTDIYIMRPLYDAQYTLLQILSTHKNTQNLTNLELLLAESLQLYFAVGPRAQPPQMRLLDLIVARVKSALLPFLGVGFPLLAETKLCYDAATNDTIAFALALGTLVSAWLERPEHAWFQAHVRAYLLDWDEQRYNETLELFPTTEGYVWLEMGMRWRELHEHMGE
jgi:hypothetical protein